MGCSGSKLDELEAVALCRGRTDHLADAIRHRYALADSHNAYTLSLRSLATSFHRFLDSAAASGGQEALPSSSPVLPLPSRRKGDPLPPPASSPPHSHSGSGSGSHIQFHSSDDDDGGSHDSPLHSENSSPNHHHFHHLDDQWQQQQQQQQYAETLGGPTSTFVNFHFARNQPPPSTVHFAPVNGGGDPSSSSSSFSPPPPYPNPSSYPYSYPYAYPTNNFYGFFGNSSSSPPPNLAPPPMVGEASTSASKPPPPPPSPPRVSTWDFLNPFEVQDRHYPPYTPSRSSREVRDEEGIPDLEEEDEDHEVVKEVYGEQKFVGSTSRGYNGRNEEGIASVGENSRPVEAENEADVVEKKVVADEVQRPPTQQNVAAASSNPRRYHNVSEIGSEIRMQFERAADAAGELSKMLEVGKHPYRHRKSSVIEASSRMMCVMPPFTSTGEDFLNFEEDMAMSSGTLSLTLRKLYIWEKKLHDEVKAEEKLRLLHDRNCKRLRHLAERGAEAQKLEDVQKMIGTLSTKIRIEIQVVNSISTKINKLRDEELWPQTMELIQGLMRMWKIMLECHRTQSQAITEAKGLDSIATSGKLNDTHLSALVDLELELLRWSGNFATWISAQKNYVKALNGWLVLCLRYEPEVTADGIPPYSPGRIGAPLVFVICNYWSQAVDRISEMDVISAMHAFTTNLRHLWEQHSVDPRQKMVPTGDMDRLVRARERDAQIIQKEVAALNKQLAHVSGHDDRPSYSAEVNSLQLGLKHIFEAMENFAANSLKAYEDVYMRTEEERGSRETGKLSG